MYLLWLRVAAILVRGRRYHGLPGRALWHRPLEEDDRSPRRHGLLLPLCFGGGNDGAGPPLDAGRVSAKSNRCWGLPLPGCSSWSGGFTTPFRWESSPCRPLSFLSLFRRSGRIAIRFPSKASGPAGWWRTSLRCWWPMRRCASACLLRCMYLVQERRIKGKLHFSANRSSDSWFAPLDWLPPLDTLERIATGHAGVRFSLHDRGPDYWFGARAGDAAWRGVLPRSQGDCIVRQAGPSTCCCSSFAIAPGCAAARQPIFPAAFSW